MKDALLSTTADAALGMSFAHLAGIARPLGRAADAKPTPRAEGDDTTDAPSDTTDAPDADPAEQTEDYKSGYRDGYQDGINGVGVEDDGAEGADEADDAKPDASTPKGARQIERSRWAAVLGSKTFARNPALGARLLATTGLGASSIVDMLRDTPAAASGHPDRSARNPDVGNAAVKAPAAKAAVDTMAAAMLRARNGKK